MNLCCWLSNGGAETLKSFSVNHVKELDADYVKFFEELLFFYSFKKYLFVHGGFNDEADNPFEDNYFMVWEKLDAYSHPLLSDKTIIHGHRPISPEKCMLQLNENRNVINVDTGCVYKDHKGYGSLTAIELFSKELYMV